MPAPSETPRRRSDPARRDEVPPENPAKTERLADERIRELQAEIDALRRENKELRLADAERRRGEKALRKEKDRVGAILSALDTGQSLVDPDMTIVWVNQKSRDILPDQEPIGQKCYRYFEGLSEPCEVCAAQRVFATGEVTRVEKYVPERGRWMNIVAQPVKDASGRVTHVLESFTDITEWKQAEEALRESETKYRTLVETALDIVLIHDSEKILYINPTGVNLLGASCPDEILGRNFLEIVHPDFRDRIQENVELDLLGEPSPTTQLQLLRLDGTPFWVEGKGVMTYIAGTPVIQVIMRDIIARKRAEEALRQHTEELVQLNRQLEEAEREANLYLDILTHDIGNTENVANLYADLLIESLEGEAAGYVKKLQRSVQKSIEILGTVSTIRRIHQASPELKETELDRVIRGAIEVFPTSAIHYTGTGRQVRADDLLPVVFNNLIGNAIKHGGPDVEIAVRVEEVNGGVQVSVEDTGPGVPDEDKEAIFHRYEQHKRGVGEGLGLYLVQIPVERYGGRVWAEDRVPDCPGEGAAFRFTLKKA